MVPELQKPRISEIQVRIDCNGCVQKIKKALNGINGIYDLHMDLPQQKLTILGWADPEKIVKAIKKTRRIATIRSHVEATESSPQPRKQASPEGSTTAPDATQQPPARPPAEPPKYTPPPEQPPPEASQRSLSNLGTNHIGEVHVIYHHPPSYGSRYNFDNSYNERWERFNSNLAFIQEPQRPYNNNPVLIKETPPPMYVTHSYNAYRPSPYVTEHEYVRSPPRHTYYNRMEYYSGDYQNSNLITSIFSDENPNACRIV